MYDAEYHQSVVVGLVGHPTHVIRPPTLSPTMPPQPHCADHNLRYNRWPHDVVDAGEFALLWMPTGPPNLTAGIVRAQRLPTGGALEGEVDNAANTALEDSGVLEAVVSLE
ncbi:hypothetical protein TIFTF001_036561 [Ficus carica]|uniref:Uncharacterized protein n=1 Tax=Ficus carica TaxID=3494 RepID=A0AA88JB78_FICCA|nr:hypothetical protein TIFTF001_036548 [Ficus carica]GMN67497.1 hypothetical protein TIFTF001_036561 [Ficus carica]